MAKQINFTYEGVDYTLEYTRNTIKQMEGKGFNIGEIDSKPLTVFPELFAGAFLCHHKKTERSKIDEIYKHLPNKEELISKLSEMYAEPIMSLLEDPDSEVGEVRWGANW